VVTEHVDDDAIWVSDKETANAPGLVRQRIDDLKAKRNGLGMGRVNILNLDRQIRMRRCLSDPRTRVICAVGLLGDANVNTQPMSMATSKPKNSV
jgi:hypothetical protein